MHGHDHQLLMLLRTVPKESREKLNKPFPMDLLPLPHLEIPPKALTSNKRPGLTPAGYKHQRESPAYPKPFRIPSLVPRQEEFVHPAVLSVPACGTFAIPIHTNLLGHGNSCRIIDEFGCLWTWKERIYSSDSQNAFPCSEKN